MQVNFAVKADKISGVRLHARVVVTCAVAMALLTMPRAAMARLCGGDCNDDRFVSVNELINGVLIVLGKRPLNSCAAFDTGGDHAVTIDELLRAVNHALNSPCRFKVGMRTLNFEDLVRKRRLRTNVWYPADGSAQEVDFALEGIFRGRAAVAAPLVSAPQRFPLVLLSHGSGGGGSDQVWLAEHLAAHGYISAAVYHFGNTFGNDSPEGVVTIWRRPTDLSFVLTELLAHPTFGERIDGSRIGAAGHSSGGYTVIALAGAVYRNDLMEAYCVGPQAGPDCEFPGDIDFSQIEDLDLASASYRDERVRAVFAMAPAVGQGFDAAGLAPVQIPVHIVGGVNDTLLPFSLHAQHYAGLIVGSQLTALEGGGHFVFMPLCNELGLRVDPELCLMSLEACLNICQDKTVDRAAIHRRMWTLALDFFDTHVQEGR